MQIHLIADEKSVVLTREIQEFLLSLFKGSGVEFRLSERTVGHREFWTWEDIFNVTGDCLRDQPHTDKALFLLSGMNENNWFAAQALDSSRMAFVHTNLGEDFGFSAFHRVAYHVLAVLTRSMFFGNLRDSFDTYHEESIGCMNDFTSNKAEVVGKIRSGYICKSCLAKMMDSPNAHPQAVPFLEAAIRGFAKIRSEVNHIDLTAFVKKEEKVVLKVDYGYEFSVQIGSKVVPLEFGEGWEKALYLYLLDHSEGLLVKDISERERVRGQVALYYSKFCGNITPGKALEQLNNWMESAQVGDRISPHLSRIRKVVGEALTNHPEIMEKLTIHTQRNKPKQLDLTGIKVQRFDRPDGGGQALAKVA